MSRAANRRHNPRRDDNEPEIVEALTWGGALVERLNGSGLPDLLVGTPQGRLVLLEVKNPATRWRLTAQESAWHELWGNYPVCVVTSPEQALDAIAGHSGGGSKYTYVPIAPDWCGA